MRRRHSTRLHGRGCREVAAAERWACQHGCLGVRVGASAGRRQRQRQQRVPVHWLSKGIRGLKTTLGGARLQAVVGANCRTTAQRGQRRRVPAAAAGRGARLNTRTSTWRRTSRCRGRHAGGCVCRARGGCPPACGQRRLRAPACKRDEAIPVRTIIITARASARAVCHSNAREGERHQ